MALREILQVPDERLRTVCAPVEVIDDALRTLASDMLETMYAATGRGLAAPQVGAFRRLFVMDAGWKDGTPEPRIFVNPQVVAVSDDLATGEEGCLSIPGDPVLVSRPADVTLRWMDLDRTIQDAVFTGFEAVCVQHETDHLDGMLCTDRAEDA